MDPRVWWHNGIWFSGTTPKYSVLSWIAINRLATCDRLIQWNPHDTSSCSLCYSVAETGNHLFFSCSFSTEVWSNLTGKLLGRRHTNNWTTVLELLVYTNIDKETIFFYVMSSRHHYVTYGVREMIADMGNQLKARCRSLDFWTNWCEMESHHSKKEVGNVLTKQWTWFGSRA